METNLEKYAKGMSNKIKESGLECYHWTEVSTVIDELIKYAFLKNAEKKEGESNGRL